MRQKSDPPAAIGDLYRWADLSGAPLALIVKIRPLMVNWFWVNRFGELVSVIRKEDLTAFYSKTVRI